MEVALLSRAAFAQAIQRKGSLVPASGLHVVHVETEYPQAQGFRQAGTLGKNILDVGGGLHRFLVTATSQCPRQPVTVAESARLRMYRQPTLLGLVVRRKRMTPRTFVVQSLRAGGIVLD